ncbi:hypothetical protein PENTCL1PPCAC_29473, partial [Pristionchus entomophagus]
NDTHYSCASWYTNPVHPFCVNILTAAQKAFFCARTCSFEISPTADCAIYTVANNVLTRQTTIQRCVYHGNGKCDQLAAGATVSRVYVGNTCTLALYTQQTPDPATDTPAETKVGSAGNFQTVTTATNAASYKCTCT